MSIALNSLRNLAVRSATVVFILLLGVLTARLLGPEGRGVYALVTLYASVGVALLGGMGAAAGYHISNLRRPVPAVVADVTALALFAGTLALAASLVISWLVGRLGGTAPWWVVLVGAAQPGLLVSSALTWAFLGADDHRNYSYAIIAPSACGLALVTLALLLFPDSTRAALLGWLLAQYAVLPWLWWRGRGVWTPLPFDGVTVATLRAIVGFSLMSGLANVVSILNLRADLLLTERFLGEAAVGVYSVAVLVVEGLYFISQAVGIAIWARVGSADRAGAADLVARSLRFSLAIMGVVGAALFLLAGLVIPLFFGGAYREAVAPLRAFIPGVVGWGMANLLAAFYTNQLGRPRTPLVIASLSLAINVLLCLIFIPAFGIIGGALATTVAYLIAIAVELSWFRRDTGVPWSRLLWLSGADLREARSTVNDIVAARRRAPLSSPAPAPPTEPSTPAEANSPAVFRRRH